MKTNIILQGDALTKLKELPNESINCIMTSPPYWALRDYGIEGQLGLEPTFDLYIKHLCDIFDEVKRVLRKDGTCWVNLGDSYYGNSSYSNSGRAGFAGKDGNSDEWKRQFGNGKCLYCGKPCETQFCDRDCLNKMGNDFRSQNRQLPSKCLVCIPDRFRIEMINRGWILRNKIIWKKPNCMPSSVKDRFTVDFEDVMLFTKSKKYWFETQYEPMLTNDTSQPRGSKGVLGTPNSGRRMPPIGGKKQTEGNFNPTYSGNTPEYNPKGRNKRTVWSICPQPFGEGVCLVCGYYDKPSGKQEKKGYFGGEDKSKRVCRKCGSPLTTSHFAIYPEELCETPIKAGCPEFVCKKCGKPKVAIFEPSEKYKNKLKQSWTEDTDKDKELRMEIGFQARTKKHSCTAEYIHKGYKTTCSCNAEFTGGIVLDPFFGAGTTGLVALKQNKKLIGIELNKEYIKIAEARLKPFLEQTKL